MSRSNAIRFVSIIIILVVLSIPIAVAQQAELVFNKVAGSQTGRDGYYRPDEGLYIEALASYAADPNGIQADQLRLYIDGNRNLPFQGCEFTSGIKYKCTLTTGSSPAPGAHTIQARMYRDEDKYVESATPVISRTSPITSDILGGQATDLLVVPAATKDGKIQIRYTAIDRAMEYTPQNVCVGIDSIELLLDDPNSVPFATITGNGACMMEGVLSKTFTSLSNGMHNVIVRVKDRFGQAGQLAPAAFLMDNAVPGVQPDTVTVINSDTGDTVRFVRSEEVTFADITIKLTKANLSTSKVLADFSAMSTSAGYKDRAADTVKDFSYTWLRVPIIGMSTCSMLVKATDPLGNTAASSAMCSVQNDDIGPTAVSMETSIKDSSNTYYIGRNGTLIITFADAGIGLNASTAFAGLGELTGRTSTPATVCDSSGTSYRCRWEISPTRPDGVKTVTAHSSTTDLLGNPLQAEKSLSVMLDASPPVITRVSQRLIEGPSGGFEVPVRGSSIEFTLNGTGFDPSMVTANVSALGGESLAQMSCAGTGCTLVSSVSTSGPMDAKITFTASDAAGNSAKAYLTVPIAELMNDTPNFWESSPVCSPLIDRSSTTLIQQKVYCDANLHSNNPWARPMSVSFSGISGCTGDVSKLIESAEAFNLAGGMHPTFGLTLYATEYKYNELVVNCPLEIMTIINQSGRVKVTSIPETQNVSMHVQFYNLPLSEMDKNIQQQVDDAVTDAKDNLKWIGTLEKFFGLASRVCNLKVIWTNLMEGFSSLKNLFGGAALTSLPGTPTRALLEANYKKFCDAEQKTSKKHEDMFGFLDQLCTFVNCRSTQEDSSGEGATSFLAKIGGGTKQCKDIQSKLASIGGLGGVKVPDIQNKYTYLGGMAASIDIKNSLIMSALCLCVPGIIHNLNKMREIKCQYALCMLREVKDGGFPPSYCKDLESYEYCNFLIGDVFSILPIFRLWDQVMNILKNVYANPFEAVPLLIGVSCQSMCKSPEMLYKHNACMLPKTLAKIGDAIGSVRSIKNLKDYLTPGQGGFCDQIDTLTGDKNETTSTLSSLLGL